MKTFNLRTVKLRPGEEYRDEIELELEPFDVLIVEFARAKGATAVVKGLRAISDFEYELEMASLNRLQDRDIESVYLMASPEYSFLRSSGVKEIATFGGDISSLVPPTVARRLQEELTRQRTTR